MGEGPTEQYYFTHLKRLFRYTCTIKPHFFDNQSISDFDKRIKKEKLLSAKITVIYVFDKDVSSRNQKENEKLVKIQHKYRNNKGIIFCDSMPSIEYWFLLHFKETYPNFHHSEQTINELVKFIPDYAKTKDFLEKENWVRDMSIEKGSIKKAMTRAKKSCSGNGSYSKIYKAFEKLNDTTKPSMQ